MIDIHCHLLPGLDDGPASWDDALAMARMAHADGTQTIVATPHQLGNYARNLGSTIRERVAEMQERLQAAGLPLQVAAGADVRIEADLPQRLQSGEVLTLADRRKHVLLELPHELYFPIGPLLKRLSEIGIVGILSHPERNQGILSEPKIWESLVDAGCLMQVTASSLLGAFGSTSQRLSESMLQRGCVHFLASDGHGVRSRRPLLQAAFRRAAELTDEGTAIDLCRNYPGRVFAGEPVPAGRRPSLGRRAESASSPKKPWYSFGLRARRASSGGQA